VWEETIYALARDVRREVLEAYTHVHLPQRLQLSGSRSSVFWYRVPIRASQSLNSTAVGSFAISEEAFELIREALVDAPGLEPGTPCM
jgi:hypothetical protein